jgi:hypothetical protein
LPSQASAISNFPWRPFRHVGVILCGEPAIGRLDLVGAGIPLDPRIACSLCISLFCPLAGSPPWRSSRNILLLPLLNPA